MADEKYILIVEDDADISMVEEAYLKSAGYRTKILTDGTEVETAVPEICASGWRRSTSRSSSIIMQRSTGATHF